MRGSAKEEIHWARLSPRKFRRISRTLWDLFDGESKGLLLFYLYRKHGISVYEPGNLSRKKKE